MSPLLVVFICAVVATLAVLAWELATNFGRTPKWGGSSWTQTIASFPVLPRGLNTPAPGLDSAPDPGANPHGDAA